MRLAAVVALLLFAACYPTVEDAVREYPVRCLSCVANGVTMDWCSDEPETLTCPKAAP